MLVLAGERTERKMAKPTFAQMEELYRQIAIGRVTQEIFQNLLEGKLYPFCPVWKSVIIGTNRSQEEVVARLCARDHRLTNWTMGLVRKMPLARALARLDLAKVTGADLGFNFGVTIEEIFTRAHERGFGLCPAEVGPALREQYSDQPMDEHLRIGMEPIDVFGDNPRVFSVSHDGGGCWLGTDLARPACFWDSKHSWIFLHSNQ